LESHSNIGTEEHGKQKQTATSLTRSVRKGNQTRILIVKYYRKITIIRFFIKLTTIAIPAMPEIKIILHVFEGNGFPFIISEIAKMEGRISTNPETPKRNREKGLPTCPVNIF
jgi:hypothetical protein